VDSNDSACFADYPTLIVTLGHGELLDYWDDFDVNAVNHKVFCKGKGSVNVVGSGDGEGDWECVCDFSGIDL
jgi:hypothetical protein